MQYPPPGDFDSTCLEWYGTLGNFAWIPKDRLNDFIWGENMRDSFHTQFCIERSTKHKTNGIGPVQKSVTPYNCCFGPEDKRHWKDIMGKKVPVQMKAKESGVYLKKKTITGASTIYIHNVLFHTAKSSKFLSFTRQLQIQSLCVTSTFAVFFQL